MAALPGYKASLYVTSAGVTITTGSPSVYTDSGDHQNYTAPSAKRYLDDTVAVNVQTSPDGTTWTTISPTLYALTYVGGALKFTPALTAGTQVRLNAGSYLPYSFLGDAKSIEIQNQMDIQDATAFQNPSSPWKTKVATLVESDIKLGKWWVDQTFASMITNSSRLVVSAFSGANANQRWEGFGRLKSNSIKAAVNALITQDLEFMVDGQLYWVAS